MNNPKYHEFQQGMHTLQCIAEGCFAFRNAPVHTLPTDEQDENQEAVKQEQDSSIPTTEIEARPDVGLLPCDHCGWGTNHRRFWEDGKGFIIQCDNCLAMVFGYSESVAISLWNTRATPAPPVATVDSEDKDDARLREMLRLRKELDPDAPDAIVMGDAAKNTSLPRSQTAHESVVPSKDPQPVPEMDNDYLLQLSLEVYARAVMNPQSELMHNRAMECRNELHQRLSAHAALIAVRDVANEFVETFRNGATFDERYLLDTVSPFIKKFRAALKAAGEKETPCQES